MTAYRGPNASRCLLEVETAESYKTKHALAQYRAFVNFGRLVVCVPSRVEIDARIFLAMQGIDAIVIGYAEPATRPPLLGMVTAPTRIR